MYKYYPRGNRNSSFGVDMKATAKECGDKRTSAQRVGVFNGGSVGASYACCELEVGEVEEVRPPASTAIHRCPCSSSTLAPACRLEKAADSKSYGCH